MHILGNYRDKVGNSIEVRFEYDAQYIRQLIGGCFQEYMYNLIFLLNSHCII